MMLCNANINSERAPSSLLFLKDLFLLCLFFMPHILFTQQSNNTVLFKIDSHRATLKIATFNGKEYFAFSSLNRVPIKRANKQEEYFTIQYGKYQFTFIQGSIYFVLGNSELQNEQILQISVPTIYLNGELWIPFKSFTNALVSIPLFEYSISSNSVILNTKKEKITKASPEKKRYTPNDTIPTKTNRLKNRRASESFGAKNQPTKPTSPLPRLNLTTNERFSLESRSLLPEDKKSSTSRNANKTIIEKTKQKVQRDTTIDIPPKYYVLPPVLKNNPK